MRWGYKNALRLIEGDMDDFDYERNEEEIFSFKNSLLIPLFLNLKKNIRKLKETPFDELLIERSELMEKADKEQSEQLHLLFNQLLRKKISESRKETNLISFLEKKLLLLFNVLNDWERYIDILGMSYEKIREIRNQSLQDEDSPKNQQEEAKASKIDNESLEKEFQDFLTYLNKEKIANQDSTSPLFDQESIMSAEREFSELKSKGADVFKKKDAGNESVIEEKSLNFDPFCLDIVNLEQLDNIRGPAETLNRAFFTEVINEKLCKIEAELSENKELTKKVDLMRKAVLQIADIRIKEPQLLNKLLNIL